MKEEREGRRERERGEEREGEGRLGKRAREGGEKKGGRRERVGGEGESESGEGGEDREGRLGKRARKEVRGSVRRIKLTKTICMLKYILAGVAETCLHAVNCS